MGATTNVREFLGEVARLVGRTVPYVSDRGTRTLVEAVRLADGTMTLSTRKGRAKVRKSTVTLEVCRTLADAWASRRPFHVDSLLGGSGNNRSAIEATMAAMQDVFVARLPRSGGSALSKHLVRIDGRKHRMGRPALLGPDETQLFMLASPDAGPVFPPPPACDDGPRFTHHEMQAMIVEFGRRLGMDVHVAVNDKNARAGRRRLGTMRGVIPTLRGLPGFTREVIKRAGHCDVIWIGKDGAVEYVFEVEHSTPVWHGFNRMSAFRTMEGAPRVRRTVTVADARHRSKFDEEAKRPEYRGMPALFLSFDMLEKAASAMPGHAPIKGATPAFLENWCVRPRKSVLD